MFGSGAVAADAAAGAEVRQMRKVPMYVQRLLHLSHQLSEARDITGSPGALLFRCWIAFLTFSRIAGTTVDAQATSSVCAVCTSVKYFVVSKLSASAPVNFEELPGR